MDHSLDLKDGGNEFDTHLLAHSSPQIAQIDPQTAHENNGMSQNSIFPLEVTDTSISLSSKSGKNDQSDHNFINQTLGDASINIDKDTISPHSNSSSILSTLNGIDLNQNTITTPLNSISSSEENDNGQEKTEKLPSCTNSGKTPKQISSPKLFNDINHGGDSAQLVNGQNVSHFDQKNPQEVHSVSKTHFDDQTTHNNHSTTLNNSLVVLTEPNTSEFTRVGGQIGDPADQIDDPADQIDDPADQIDDQIEQIDGQLEGGSESFSGGLLGDGKDNTDINGDIDASTTTARRGRPKLTEAEKLGKFIAKERLNEKKKEEKELEKKIKNEKKKKKLLEESEKKTILVEQGIVKPKPRGRPSTKGQNDKIPPTISSITTSTVMDSTTSTQTTPLQSFFDQNGQSVKNTQTVSPNFSNFQNNLPTTFSPHSPSIMLSPTTTTTTITTTTTTTTTIPPNRTLIPHLSLKNGQKNSEKNTEKAPANNSEIPPAPLPTFKLPKRSNTTTYHTALSLLNDDNAARVRWLGFDSGLGKRYNRLNELIDFYGHTQIPCPVCLTPHTLAYLETTHRNQHAVFFVKHPEYILKVTGGFDKVGSITKMVKDGGYFKQLQMLQIAQLIRKDGDGLEEEGEEGGGKKREEFWGGEKVDQIDQIDQNNFDNNNSSAEISFKNENFSPHDQFTPNFAQFPQATPFQPQQPQQPLSTAPNQPNPFTPTISTSESNNSTHISPNSPQKQQNDVVPLYNDFDCHCCFLAFSTQRALKGHLILSHSDLFQSIPEIVRSMGLKQNPNINPTILSSQRPQWPLQYTFNYSTETLNSSSTYTPPGNPIGLTYLQPLPQNKKIDPIVASFTSFHQLHAPAPNPTPADNENHIKLPLPIDVLTKTREEYSELFALMFWSPDCAISTCGLIGTTFSLPRHNTLHNSKIAGRYQYESSSYAQASRKSRTVQPELPTYPSHMMIPSWVSAVIPYIYRQTCSSAIMRAILAEKIKDEFDQHGLSMSSSSPWRKLLLSLSEIAKSTFGDPTPPKKQPKETKFVWKISPVIKSRKVFRTRLVNRSRLVKVDENGKIIYAREMPGHRGGPGGQKKYKPPVSVMRKRELELLKAELVDDDSDDSDDGDEDDDEEDGEGDDGGDGDYQENDIGAVAGGVENENNIDDKRIDDKRIDQTNVDENINDGEKIIDEKNENNTEKSHSILTETTINPENGIEIVPEYYNTPVELMSPLTLRGNVWARTTNLKICPEFKFVTHFGYLNPKNTSESSRNTPNDDKTPNKTTRFSNLGDFPLECIENSNNTFFPLVELSSSHTIRISPSAIAIIQGPINHPHIQTLMVVPENPRTYSRDNSLTYYPNHYAPQRQWFSSARRAIGYHSQYTAIMLASVAGGVVSDAHNSELTIGGFHMQKTANVLTLLTATHYSQLPFKPRTIKNISLQIVRLTAGANGDKFDEDDLTPEEILLSIPPTSPPPRFSPAIIDQSQQELLVPQMGVQVSVVDDVISDGNVGGTTEIGLKPYQLAPTRTTRGAMHNVQNAMSGGSAQAVLDQNALLLAPSSIIFDPNSPQGRLIGNSNKIATVGRFNHVGFRNQQTFLQNLPTNSLLHESDDDVDLVEMDNKVMQPYIGPVLSYSFKEFEKYGFIFPLPFPTQFSPKIMTIMHQIPTIIFANQHSDLSQSQYLDHFSTHRIHNLYQYATQPHYQCLICGIHHIASRLPTHFENHCLFNPKRAGFMSCKKCGLTFTQQRFYDLHRNEVHKRWVMKNDHPFVKHLKNAAGLDCIIFTPENGGKGGKNDKNDKNDKNEKNIITSIDEGPTNTTTPLTDIDSTPPTPYDPSIDHSTENNEGNNENNEKISQNSGKNDKSTEKDEKDEKDKHNPEKTYPNDPKTTILLLGNLSVVKTYSIICTLLNPYVAAALFRIQKSGVVITVSQSDPICLEKMPKSTNLSSLNYFQHNEPHLHIRLNDVHGDDIGIKGVEMDIDGFYGEEDDGEKNDNNIINDQNDQNNEKNNEKNIIEEYEKPKKTEKIIPNSSFSVFYNNFFIHNGFDGLNTAILLVENNSYDNEYIRPTDSTNSNHYDAPLVTKSQLPRLLKLLSTPSLTFHRHFHLITELNLHYYGTVQNLMGMIKGQGVVFSQLYLLFLLENPQFRRNCQNTLQSALIDLQIIPHSDDNDDKCADYGFIIQNAKDEGYLHPLLSGQISVHSLIGTNSTNSTNSTTNLISSPQNTSFVPNLANSSQNSTDATQVVTNMTPNILDKNYYQDVNVFNEFDIIPDHIKGKLFDEMKKQSQKLNLMQKLSKNDAKLSFELNKSSPLYQHIFNSYDTGIDFFSDFNKALLNVNFNQYFEQYLYFFEFLLSFNSPLFKAIDQRVQQSLQTEIDPTTELYDRQYNFGHNSDQNSSISLPNSTKNEAISKLFPPMPLLQSLRGTRPQSTKIHFDQTEQFPVLANKMIDLIMLYYSRLNDLRTSLENINLSALRVSDDQIDGNDGKSMGEIIDDKDSDNDDDDDDDDGNSDSPIDTIPGEDINDMNSFNVQGESNDIINDINLDDQTQQNEESVSNPIELIISPTKKRSSFIPSMDDDVDGGNDNDERGSDTRLEPNNLSTNISKKRSAFIPQDDDMNDGDNQSGDSIGIGSGGATGGFAEQRLTRAIHSTLDYNSEQRIYRETPGGGITFSNIMVHHKKRSGILANEYLSFVERGKNGGDNGINGNNGNNGINGSNNHNPQKLLKKNKKYEFSCSSTSFYGRGNHTTDNASRSEYGEFESNQFDDYNQQEVGNFDSKNNSKNITQNNNKNENNFGHFENLKNENQNNKNLNKNLQFIPFQKRHLYYLIRVYNTWIELIKNINLLLDSSLFKNQLTNYNTENNQNNPQNTQNIHTNPEKIPQFLRTISNNSHQQFFHLEKLSILKTSPSPQNNKHFVEGNQSSIGVMASFPHGGPIARANTTYSSHLPLYLQPIQTYLPGKVLKTSQSLLDLQLLNDIMNDTDGVGGGDVGGKDVGRDEKSDDNNCENLKNNDKNDKSEQNLGCDFDQHISPVSSGLSRTYSKMADNDDDDDDITTETGEFGVSLVGHLKKTKTGQNNDSHFVQLGK